MTGWTRKNYPKVLDKLAELVREGQNVDMMLCNYIYDKQGVKHKKAIRYANVFPQDQVFYLEGMQSIFIWDSIF